MNLYYNDTICEITHDGYLNIIKQFNGAKFSIVGAALINDYDNWLKSIYQKYINEGINDFKNISIDTLKEHTSLIYKNIEYKNVNDKYVVVNSKDLNKSFYELCLPSQISFDETDDKTHYTSYDVIIKKDNILCNTDVTADGVALFALPFKTDVVDENKTSPYTTVEQPVLFSITYFPNDKIKIFKDQPNSLAFNSEIHFNIGEDMILDELSLSDDVSQYNIHLLNESDELSEVGSIDNLLISNKKDIPAQESFAKVNIVSDGHAYKNNYNTYEPQIRLLLKDPNKDSWDGDRIDISYNSGYKASLFTIAETTGNQLKSKPNLDLFGESNTFVTSANNKTIFTDTTPFGNSLIYSEHNYIYSYSNNNSLINSEYNGLNHSSANNLFNSNHNNLYSYSSAIKNKNEYPDIHNNTFINSHNNEIKAYIDYRNYHIKGRSIANASLITSNDNYISGANESGIVYINTNSSYYSNNAGGGKVINIDNNYGYMSNNKGDTIAIGEGLINVNSKTSAHRILLGRYNSSSFNEGDLLIVGDGNCSTNYLKSTIDNGNTPKDGDAFFNEFATNDKKQSNNSVLSRHNIFSVNKNGYVTINKDENNYVNYCVSGINGVNNGTPFNIPFDLLYPYVQPQNYINQMTDKFNGLASSFKMLYDLTPTTDFIELTDNTKLSIYLYPEDKNEENIDNQTLIEHYKTVDNTELIVCNNVGKTVTVHYQKQFKDNGVFKEIELNDSETLNFIYKTEDDDKGGLILISNKQ